MSAESALAPLAIEQAGPRSLRIRWSDAHESVYAVRDIRMNCRCASCIEEMTGRPLLREEDVPEDVVPRKIATVGRYAIRIDWSDGHDTGIYTFERLREICPCCTEKAQAAR